MTSYPDVEHVVVDRHTFLAANAQAQLWSACQAAHYALRNGSYRRVPTLSNADENPGEVTIDERTPDGVLDGPRRSRLDANAVSNAPRRLLADREREPAPCSHAEVRPLPGRGGAGGSTPRSWARAARPRWMARFAE